MRTNDGWLAACTVLYRLWGLLLMATLRQVNDEQRASRASSASSICDTRLVFISMELLSGSTTISGMLCGCGSRFGPKVTFEVGSYACNLLYGVARARAQHTATSEQAAALDGSQHYDS